MAARSAASNVSGVERSGDAALVDTDADQCSGQIDMASRHNPVFFLQRVHGRARDDDQVGFFTGRSRRMRPPVVSPM